MFSIQNVIVSNLLFCVVGQIYVCADRNHYGAQFAQSRMSLLSQKTRRMHDGKPIKISHYPFVASVNIVSFFLCAGAIIKSDLVITASNCLPITNAERNNAKLTQHINVRAGSSYHQRGKKYQAKRIHFNPLFETSKINNLAIIRLKTHIKFKPSRVMKIKMDLSYPVEPPKEKKLVVLGWKSNGAPLLDYYTPLQKLVLDVKPKDECQSINDHEIPPMRTFCIGVKSNDTNSPLCDNTDRGSPVISNGMLVGVVAMLASTCFEKTKPAIVARLSLHKDWIEAISKDKQPLKALTRTTPPTTSETAKARVHETMNEDIDNYEYPNAKLIQKVLLDEIKRMKTEFDEDQKMQKQSKQEVSGEDFQSIFHDTTTESSITPESETTPSTIWRTTTTKKRIKNVPVALESSKHKTLTEKKNVEKKEINGQSFYVNGRLQHNGIALEDDENDAKYDNMPSWVATIQESTEVIEPNVSSASDPEDESDEEEYPIKSEEVKNSVDKSSNSTPKLETQKVNSQKFKAPESEFENDESGKDTAAKVETHYVFSSSEVSNEKIGLSNEKLKAVEDESWNNVDPNVELDNARFLNEDSSSDSRRLDIE